MNLEALESFRVFARTLNFTRTAEIRHLTQPALHKQIKTLGESLGVELYRKEGRALLLTEAGVMVARFSCELGDRIELLHATLQGRRAEMQVALAAGRGSFLFLLGEALRSFHQAYPGRLQLLTENRDGTLKAVRSGEAKLGVTVLDELPQDLGVSLLREVAPHLVVSSRHPLANRKSLRIEALDGLPLVCPAPPSVMRELIAQRLASAGLEFNPVINTTGWDLMMHFASLDIGAAIVNGCCRPPPDTVAIRLLDFPKTRYYLVAPLTELPTPELNYLRECIFQHAKKAPLFS